MQTSWRCEVTYPKTSVRKVSDRIPVENAVNCPHHKRINHEHLGARTGKSMTDPLPIGVIVPTRNCRATLPAHLASMMQWLKNVREIVVVDGDSEDGTLDWLRKHLDHPRIRLLSKPRGLYQAWNAAIREIRTPFTYISTIGDAIEPDGLSKLLRTAEDLGADAIISPPRLCDARGNPVQMTWPVHELLLATGLREPAILHPMFVFLWSASSIPAGILGSSASNLYRTTMLQARPFPEDLGHGGDVAWGLENSLRIRLGIHPRVVSMFQNHEREDDSNWGEHKRNPYTRLIQLIRKALDQTNGSPAEMQSTGTERILFEQASRELLGILEAWIRAKTRLKTYRYNGFPWILRPGAWVARSRRKASSRSLHDFRSGRLLDFFCTTFALRPPERTAIV